MKREALSEEIIQTLIAKAISMREYSYVPYSHFRVGAALLAADGTVYGGCNIENAAYSPTNCAERTAVFKAVSEGCRDFSAICIVGGGEQGIEDYCPPCGVCRQVLMEFVKPEEFLIVLAVGPEQYQILTLAELFPRGFGPDNL